MAVVQVNIPEKLWERLQQTGRPIEEVVVEAREKSFEESSRSSVQEPSKAEIVQRLIDAQLVREPGEWDTPAAKRWQALSEEEKQRHINEMDSMYFPDSPASSYILESRR
jgi:hypothetical protein